jgi:hypothetical protein
MAANQRRNVQQQNEETQSRIRRVASSFIADPLRFHWLIETLTERSLSPQDGVLVELKQLPDQAGDVQSGLWLSRERRFYKFAVLLPRTDAPIEIEEWGEVTAEMPVSAHQPGTGRTFAFAALEVLDELSGATDKLEVPRSVELR